MSAPALGAAAPATSGIAPGALAAGERVARLQTLAAELREGPSSFTAALREASSGQQAPSQPSGAGESGAQYAPLIEAAAQRNGIDPAVLHGLIEQESGFDPSSRSSAGAVGLTQLMPSTAASLGVSEPLDPAQSIEGGARYLGEMLQRFGGNVEDALAAYNAGPGAVERYGGVPPYAETQQYVSKVLGYAAECAHGAGSARSVSGVSAAPMTGASVGASAGATGGTNPASAGAIA